MKRSIIFWNTIAIMLLTLLACNFITNEYENYILYEYIKQIHYNSKTFYLPPTYLLLTNFFIDYLFIHLFIYTFFEIIILIIIIIIFESENYNKKEIYNLLTKKYFFILFNPIFFIWVLLILLIYKIVIFTEKGIIIINNFLDKK